MAQKFEDYIYAKTKLAFDKILEEKKKISKDIVK